MYQFFIDASRSVRTLCCVSNERQPIVEHENLDSRRHFASRQLPVLLGAVFLLVYLVSLCRWVSLGSLETTARVCGWLWKPELLRPVTFTLLAPLAILPERWAIIGLHLFSAVAGALVLGMLARSVALWPRPARRMRTEHRVQTLSGATAALPVLLATLVCGFSMSFWEHATAGTGEMLNLLLLAFTILCILEYRRDHHDAWLFTASLVFSASMANNWLNVAFAPLFIGAVLAVKRMALFNRWFALRFFLMSAVGLCFYFLWPIVDSVAYGSNFWDILKGNLKFQQQMLATLKRPVWIALVLTCVAPLIAISIGWKKPITDVSNDNAISVLFGRALIHAVHAGFLLMGLWMACGAAFNPRHLGRPLGLSLLPLDYFSALVVGYCAGYLLLMRVVQLVRWAHLAVTVAIAALIIVIPLAQLARNSHQLSLTNGYLLQQFTATAIDALPAGPCALLSDEPALLLLAKAELASRLRRDVTVIDTRHLRNPAYRIFLARQAHKRWPVPTGPLYEGTLSPRQMTDLLCCWQQVYYLHPSFGYFFEKFHGTQTGLLQRLTVRVTAQSTNSTEYPVAELQNTGAIDESSWKNLWTLNAEPLARDAAKERLNFNAARSAWVDKLKLMEERNSTLAYVATLYSRAMNTRAVQLQRFGRWEEAAEFLQRALDLRPANQTASLNLAYNLSRTNLTPSPALSAARAALLQSQSGLHIVLREDGPADESAILELAGQIFLAGGNYRQAFDSFARCAEIQPDRPEPCVLAAQALLALEDWSAGLEWLERAAARGPDSSKLAASILGCRAQALAKLGRNAQIQPIIEAAIARHPASTEVLSVVAQIHLWEGRFPEAVAMFDKLVRIAPNIPELLAAKGVAELRQNPAAALETLSRAVALAPSNLLMRLNRAVAALNADALDVAEADFIELSKHPAAAGNPGVLFGRAELAWRKQDRAAALLLYKQLLSAAPAESVEHQVALDRLRALEQQQ